MSGAPPRRRHSAAVYRRRRIVLLAVVAAGRGRGGVAAHRAALAGRGGADRRADPTPTPSATQATATDLPVPDTAETATPTPTPTKTADAAAEVEPTASPEATPTAKPCVARDVAVEAVSDQETYEPGQNPQLSITLTNNGATDCTLNVGTSGQSFTVMSGSDIWWRSTDCQTEPSDMVVLLAAGQSVSSAAPLTWDRTRSAVGTCGDSDRQSAPGGGASYHLSVEIGGIASTQSAQILLY